MARGQPDSLYLEKRDPGHCQATRTQSGRACPPQYTAQEWVSLRTGAGSSRDNPLLGEMCCCTPMEAGVTLMLMQMPTRCMTQSSTPTGVMAQNMYLMAEMGKAGSSTGQPCKSSCQHRKFRVQQWHKWCRGEDRCLRIRIATAAVSAEKTKQKVSAGGLGWAAWLTLQNPTDERRAALGRL